MSILGLARCFTLLCVSSPVYSLPSNLYFYNLTKLLRSEQKECQCIFVHTSSDFKMHDNGLFYSVSASNSPLSSPPRLKGKDTNKGGSKKRARKQFPSS